MPLRSGPAAAESLTPEQAVSELKKVGGHVNDDKLKPGEPVVRVWLQDARINDANLVLVKSLPALTRINLVGVNSVTDAGMVHLSGLKNLEQLNLEGTRIGDRGLEQIKGLANLQSLSLVDTDVTSAGLVHLKGMKKLKRLVLSFTDVDDAAIEHLGSLNSLATVVLDDTKVTEEGAEKLRQVLPKCKILTSTKQIAVVTTVDSPAESTTIGSIATDRYSATANNGDWPQWRGPNRDGISHESGLLEEWSEDGPPLRWEATGMEWGHSTVVAQGGVLFTSGYRDKQMFVTALEAKTGKRVWQTAVPVNGTGFVLSTPTLDGKNLYALACEGDLVCLDIAKGALLWRRNFATEFGGEYQSAGMGGGYSESVLIDGDLLICTPGGPEAMMAGLDKSTGKTLWQTKCPADIGSQGIDAAGFSSAIVSNACGVRQYVQNTGRGLMSVNAEGTVLWTYNRIANTYGNIPTPIVQGDYVFASTAHANDGKAGTALLKIICDGSGLKADEVYRVPERVVGNHHGGMILVGDCIYMGHGYNRGFPLCLEMKTGKIKWRPGRGPGSGSAAVAYADGHLYFRYEDGTVALARATPESFDLKSKFRPTSDQAPEWAHPVVIGGCLYLRQQNRLLCYDVKRR